MARRLDHRRGQQQLGEHLQRLHQQEGQGETTSVDTPAGQVADRGRRRVGSLTFFSLAKWPATSTPSGCFMLPLDAQRTYDDTQRCAMTSIHTPDHCTCPTTARRVVLGMFPYEI